MRQLAWAAAVLGLAATTAGRARAAIVLTATESNGAVVISGGGTANLAGLTFVFGGGFAAAVAPADPLVLIGPTDTTGADTYKMLTGPGLTGPGNFGTGMFNTAVNGMGDRFGITTDNGTILLAVPTGYASGAALQGTGTFSSSFASLGMTPGTYVWKWGAGATADSLTLQVGTSTAPVPEPSSLALAGVAVAAGLLAWSRRSR
jgi:hypothetical protein